MQSVCQVEKENGEKIDALETARIELYRRTTDVDCLDSLALRRHKIFGREPTLQDNGGRLFFHTSSLFCPGSRTVFQQQKLQP